MDKQPQGLSREELSEFQTQLKILKEHGCLHEHEFGAITTKLQTLQKQHDTLFNQFHELEQRNTELKIANELLLKSLTDGSDALSKSSLEIQNNADSLLKQHDRITRLESKVADVRRKLSNPPLIECDAAMKKQTNDYFTNWRNTEYKRLLFSIRMFSIGLTIAVTFILGLKYIIDLVQFIIRVINK